MSPDEPLIVSADGHHYWDGRGWRPLPTVLNDPDDAVPPPAVANPESAQDEAAPAGPDIEGPAELPLSLPSGLSSQGNSTPGGGERRPVVRPEVTLRNDQEAHLVATLSELVDNY